MNAKLNRENITADERNEIEQEIININERIDQRETQTEGTSLKSKIKIIFKQYGFTITAVVSAVSVIIGVIVSNLSAGLSNVANGVGKGLKEIGKKIRRYFTRDAWRYRIVHFQNGRRSDRISC